MASTAPIDLYFWPTPNGRKITIALEEMELPYRLVAVNIGKGDQFKPEFLAISPNNRMPAVVDPDGPGGGPVSVFESGAILQYLGRKFGEFYPSDERARSGSDVSRNEEAFAALLDALAAGHAVLIFPEGKSHSEPAVAPLKTGLARVALQAREERGLAGVTIVPVGLVFERKWEPRSRVLVQVGVPLPMDGWRGGVAELTAEVEARLRAVTLNFDSDGAARQATNVARSLTAMSGGVRDLATPDAPLGDWLEVARRADRVRAALDSSGTGMPPRARLLLERVGALDARMAELGIALGDVSLSPALAPGVWFAVRELAILVVAGPVAAWGRLNHWVPLRLARALALRSSRSPDDPAMRTIVAGLLLVLLFYAVQTALVGVLAGPCNW